MIVGAGDIANCDALKGAEQTARLLDAIPGIVVTTGDNAYFFGSTLDYERCYDPTWGRHKARTRPSPGNHEYETAGGAPYFAYFGDNAGPSGLGYYGFSTAGWLILSLNSSVDASENSAQMAWVRQALRANPDPVRDGDLPSPAGGLGPARPDSRHVGYLADAGRERRGCRHDRTRASLRAVCTDGRATPAIPCRASSLYCGHRWHSAVAGHGPQPRQRGPGHGLGGIEVHSATRLI